MIDSQPGAKSLAPQPRKAEAQTKGIATAMLLSASLLVFISLGVLKYNQHARVDHCQDCLTVATTHLGAIEAVRTHLQLQNPAHLTDIASQSPTLIIHPDGAIIASFRAQLLDPKTSVQPKQYLVKAMIQDLNQSDQSSIQARYVMIAKESLQALQASPKFDVVVVGKPRKSAN